MAESLADAIHAAVRVGKLGPNSTWLTERGREVRLTPAEGAAAAERMAGWLAAHDAEVLARQRSQIVAGVDAALSGLDRTLRAWMVAGVSPETHERSKRWLRLAWPVLADALDAAERTRSRRPEVTPGLMADVEREIEASTAAVLAALDPPRRNGKDMRNDGESA